VIQRRRMGVSHGACFCPSQARTPDAALTVPAAAIMHCTHIAVDHGTRRPATRAVSDASVLDLETVHRVCDALQLGLQICE
jgi:hypothetical protein